MKFRKGIRIKEVQLITYLGIPAANPDKEPQAERRKQGEQHGPQDAEAHVLEALGAKAVGAEASVVLIADGA